METFKKDITFLTKTIAEGDTEWKQELTTKSATFKELSRTDRDQHKLHFKIIAIFETFGVKADDDTEGAKFKIDSDGVYDLTVKAIKTLLIEDPQFTVQDKTEFLNDSGAIFDFGMWLLGEKIAPFFSKFNQKSA